MSEPQPGDKGAIYPETINANVHKLRAILARSPETSEELAKEMNLDINVVRLLIHTSSEYSKRWDKWYWKGSQK